MVRIPIPQNTVNHAPLLPNPDRLRRHHHRKTCLHDAPAERVWHPGCPENRGGGAGKDSPDGTRPRSHGCHHWRNNGRDRCRPLHLPDLPYPGHLHRGICGRAETRPHQVCPALRGGLPAIQYQPDHNLYRHCAIQPCRPAPVPGEPAAGRFPEDDGHERGGGHRPRQAGQGHAVQYVRIVDSRYATAKGVHAALAGCHDVRERRFRGGGQRPGDRSHETYGRRHL